MMQAGKKEPRFIPNVFNHIYRLNQLNDYIFFVMID